MLTRRHWTILFTLKLLKMGLVALLLLQSRASAETLGDIGLRAEEIQRLTVALRGLRAELEAGEPRTAEAVLGELTTWWKSTGSAGRKRYGCWPSPWNNWESRGPSHRSNGWRRFWLITGCLGPN